MKGEWSDEDCLAYDGSIRIAHDGRSYVVIVDDVEVGRTPFAVDLASLLLVRLDDEHAKKLANEALSNMGPWT